MTTYDQTAFRRIETRNGPLFEDSTTGRVLTADEIVPPAEPLPIEREEHERINAPDYMGATPYGDDPE